MQHLIDDRWLPETLHNKPWFDIEDITALETEDWIFDPAKHAHYAGKIEYISDANQMITVRWFKSEDNIFIGYHTFEAMLKFWWLDPIMQ